MPEIEVFSPPVPKARPRLGKGHVFTPRKTELAADRIAKAWREQLGEYTFTCSLVMAILVRLARPLNHYGTGRNAARLRPSAPRHPHVKPDLDNYAKMVLDALKGVAFRDDGQIVDLFVSKRYVKNGQAPGWAISIWPAEENG